MNVHRQPLPSSALAQMMAVFASHSPLMLTDIEATNAQRQADFKFAIDQSRAALEAFDPELVVVFAPDHFNGLFFDLMPSFCIGLAAQSTEDWGMASESLDVPSELAMQAIHAVRDAGFDVAVSHRLKVDHGTTIPLQLLTGGIARYPVLPVVINCAADPRPSFSRSRRLGQVVGEFLITTGLRVAIIGSGGLSHDPPTPRLHEAPPHVAERLIARHVPTTQDLQARQARVMTAARSLVAGGGPCRAPSEQFDREFLATLMHGRLDDFDRYTDDFIDREAGFGGHEVRCWIAAMAALKAGGATSAELRNYAIVPEWITGMAVVEARTQVINDASVANEVQPEELSAANDI